MRRRPVLMYHAVNTAADPLYVQVTPDRLREQLRTLRRLGLRGVSVRELLAADRPPAGLVGLTFDDGYADFETTAVPILAEFGFSATVFVLAGLLGGTNEWDGGPVRALMTAEQVRAVHAAGHEVGSHGMRHIRLVDLPAEELTREVAHSKSVLEELLDAPVNGFCYPYGAISRDGATLTKQVYDYGCGVRVRPPVDRWAIPRFHVGQADGWLRLVAKLGLRPVRERLQRGQPCE